MKKLNETEMMEVNGGKQYLHCTVCHAAGQFVTYKNNVLGKIAFELHCLKDSKHKANVKRYGYGHDCCIYAHI